MKQAWKKNDFEFKQKIGSGKFGIVFRALESVQQVEVAIKTVKISSIQMNQLVPQLKNEIEITSRLNVDF